MFVKKINLAISVAIVLSALSLMSFSVISVAEAQTRDEQIQTLLYKINLLREIIAELQEEEQDNGPQNNVHQNISYVEQNEPQPNRNWREANVRERGGQDILNDIGSIPAYVLLNSSLSIYDPTYVPDIDENGFVTEYDVDFIDDVILPPQFVDHGRYDKKTRDESIEGLSHAFDGEFYAVIEARGPIYKKGLGIAETWDKVNNLRKANKLDINRDGVTDYKDVERLITNFENLIRTVRDGAVHSPAPDLYDINDDGIVSEADAFLVELFATYDEDERDKRRREDNINSTRRSDGVNIVRYIEDLEENGFLDIDGNGFYTADDGILLRCCSVYLPKTNEYDPKAPIGEGLYNFLAGYGTLRTTREAYDFIQSQDRSKPNKNWRDTITPVDFSYSRNNIKTYLKNGDDDEKINLFFVVEAKNDARAETLVSGLLDDSIISFFKTNPLKAGRDLFNVYYYRLDQADYRDRNGGIGFNSRRISNSDDPRDQRFDTVRDSINNRLASDEEYEFIYLSLSPDVKRQYAGVTELPALFYEGEHVLDGIAKSFVHEMGHQLFDLNDEYFGGLSRLAGLNPLSNVERGNKKNCITKGDDRWDDIPNWDGTLYEGCYYTDKGLFRGARNSIMTSSSFEPKDWPTAWGPINEYYINEVLNQYR